MTLTIEAAQVRDDAGLAADELLEHNCDQLTAPAIRLLATPGLSFFATLMDRPSAKGRERAHRGLERALETHDDGHPGSH